MNPTDDQQPIETDDSDHDELRAMLARSFEANAWDEPEMDAYDSYQ